MIWEDFLKEVHTEQTFEGNVLEEQVIPRQGKVHAEALTCESLTPVGNHN